MAGRLRRLAPILGLVTVLGVAAVWVLSPAPMGVGCNACDGPFLVLAVGPPNESVSHGDSLYNFSIQAAASGLLWDDLSLHLAAPGGSPIPLLGTDWNVTVFDLHGDPLAFFDVSARAPLWTSGGSAPVESGESLLWVSPAATTLNGQGDSLVVTGPSANPFTVSAGIP